MAPRILVVDDDALIRRIMCDSLVALPADVLEAGGGEEALKLARAERPDLIFLDTMMPGMDGFQVAETLKQDPTTAGIPLVFLSALGTASHKVRGLDMGAEDYLSKPVDPEELKARVRSILRRVRPPAPEPAAPPVTSGKLQTKSLASLVQSLEVEGRNTQLLLTRAGEEGELVLVGGRITRATQGPRRGEAAVYQLLTWQEGAFDLTPPPEEIGLPEGEVTVSNQDLLSEGARRLDEIAGLRAGLPGPGALMEIPAALRAALEDQVPYEGAALVVLLDGTRDLDQVLANSPFDAWMTLKILHRLLRVGALGWSAAPATAESATASAGQVGGPRRSVLRLTLEGPVQYHSLRAFQQTGRFTLSARGVFIQTATPFEVGEQTLLRFQLPGEAAWITAVGQVIWRNADAQKGKQEDLGMGLQFVEVSADSLDTVERRLTQGVAAEICDAIQQP